MAQLVMATIPVGDLHRNARLLEALFRLDADPTLFGLGGGPPAITLRATPIGEAALLPPVRSLAPQMRKRGAASTGVVPVAVCGCQLPITYRLTTSADQPETANTNNVQLHLTCPSPSRIHRATLQRLELACQPLCRPTLARQCGQLESSSSSAAFSVLARFRAQCASVHDSAARELIQSISESLLVPHAPAATLIHGAKGTGKSFAALALLRAFRQTVDVADEPETSTSPVDATGSHNNAHGSGDAGGRYLATRYVSLARLLAASEAGSVNDSPTRAWRLLEGALVEATSGLPFVGYGKCDRLSGSASSADDGDGRPLPILPALIAIDDCELLGVGGGTLQTRLVAQNLARWIESLKVRSTEQPGVPVAVVLISREEDRGGLPECLLRPSVCNAAVALRPMAVPEQRRWLASLSDPSIAATTTATVSEKDLTAAEFAASLEQSKTVVATQSRAATATATVSTTKMPLTTTVAAEGTPAAAAAARGFDDLVGVEEAVRLLRGSVVVPLRLSRAAPLAALGLRVPKGALITGPTGCGKTALLAALADSLRDVDHCHTIIVSAQALIQKEVGESEKNVARLFARARQSSPCVLLLDGLDAIAPPRGGSRTETDAASDRVLSTLLTEMDGISSSSSAQSTDNSRGTGGAGLQSLATSRGSAAALERPAVVVVIATAPAPSSLDPAIRRSGRLDVHISVAPPTVDQAAELLRRTLFPRPERIQLSATGSEQAPVISEDGDGALCRQAAEVMMARRQPPGAASAWSSYADVVGFCRELAVQTVRRHAAGAGSRSGRRPAVGDAAAQLRDALRLELSTACGIAA